MSITCWDITLKILMIIMQTYLLLFFNKVCCLLKDCILFQTLCTSFLKNGIVTIRSAVNRKDDVGRATATGTKTSTQTVFIYRI